MSPIVKTKEIIKKLPDQKRHLDFIAALLSVPVLVTVLILNLSNIENKKGPTSVSPTPSPVKTISYQATPVQTQVKSSTGNVATPTPTPSPSPSLCKADIGPVSIASPTENQTVTANPTCIDIAYSGDGYCAVVWSHKINDSSWSDYSNNSVCLYNLPQGTNTFSLKLKSLVSGKDQLLQRTFTYVGSGQAITPTPTPTIASTPSPAPTN